MNEELLKRMYTAGRAGPLAVGGGGGGPGADPGSAMNVTLYDHLCWLWEGRRDLYKLYADSVIGGARLLGGLPLDLGGLMLVIAGLWCG
jgi:hypothetical protein